MMTCVVTQSVSATTCFNKAARSLQPQALNEGMEPCRCTEASALQWASIACARAMVEGKDWVLYLEAGLNDPDVDEKVRVDNAGEHVQLIVDLARIDLVEQLHR